MTCVALPKNRGHDGNQHNSAGERADELTEEPRSFFSERAPQERPHQEKGGDMDNKELWKSQKQPSWTSSTVPAITPRLTLSSSQQKGYGFAVEVCDAITLQDTGPTAA
jgi:hypothetical protein